MLTGQIEMFACGYSVSAFVKLVRQRFQLLKLV
jgi:hypothetical protein